MFHLFRKSVLLKNFSWLAIGQVFYRIAYFIAIALLARYVSIEDYGIISYMLIYVGLWAPIFNFGLGIIGIREIAQLHINAKDFISKTFPLKIFVGIVACLLMIISGFLLGYSTEAQLFLIAFSFYAVLMSITEFFHIPFTAQEKMHVTAKLIILERTIVSTLAVLFLVLGFNSWGFVFGYVIGAVVSVVVGYLVYRNIFGAPKLIYSQEDILFFFKESWPVSLNMFFALAYSRIGVVFLEQMVNIESVAFYNSAFFLLFALQMGVSTLMQAIFPRLSKAQKASKEQLLKASVSVFKLLLPVMLILSLSLFYFSDFLIKLIYGQEFAKSVPILSILIWVFPLFSISTYWANYFRAGGRQQTMAVITGIGMAVNVMLSPIFINWNGPEGLALAYVISEALIVLISFSLILYSTNIRKPIIIFYLIMLFSTIGFSVYLKELGQSTGSFFIFSLITIIIVSTIFTRKSDIEMIKKIILR
ncbi:MAG: flippase [Balneolaceae bacterium]